jgi:ABC-type multidrug transport system permease subunit
MVLLQIKNNNVKPNITCQFLANNSFQRQIINLNDLATINLENFGVVSLFFLGKQFMVPVVDGDIIDVYQNKVISSSLDEIPGLKNTIQDEYFGSAPISNSWYYIIFFVFIFILVMLIIIGVSFFFYKKKYGSRSCLFCPNDR